MGCVALKKKDQALPTELVEKILTNNTSCLGYAAANNGEVIIELIKEPYDAKRFDDAQADLIPFEMVWQFSQMADKFNDDEVQPFAVLTIDDKVLVAVAIEGDLTSQKHPESERGGEFFLAHEYLMPKIAEMFEDAGQKLDKLCDMMRRPSFLKDLNNNIGAGTTVTFVVGNGEVLTFGHNNTLTEFDWGWVSRSYGFGATEAKPEEKKGLGSRLTGSAKKLVDNVTKAVSPAANATPTTRTENSTIIANNEGVMMAPPAECDTKAKKRDWYKSMTGAVPEGYKNGIKVLVPKDKIEIKDFKTAAEVINGDKKELPEGVHKVDNPVSKSLQTKTAIINKDVKDNALPLDQAKPPLFPVEQKKAIEGLMERGRLLKIVDINSTAIIDPKTIEAFEAKHPNFFQQAGIDRAHVDRWPFEQLLILAKTCPEALAVMAMTYRNESLKLGGPKKFTTEKQEFTRQQPLKAVATAGGRKLQQQTTQQQQPTTQTAPATAPKKNKYAM